MCELHLGLRLNVEVQSRGYIKAPDYIDGEISIEDPFPVLQQGDLPLTLDILYEFLNKRPAKVAIFGPALSPVLAVVGRVTGRRNIVQVSCQDFGHHSD